MCMAVDAAGEQPGKPGACWRRAFGFGTNTRARRAVASDGRQTSQRTSTRARLKATIPTESTSQGLVRLKFRCAGAGNGRH